MVRALVRCGGSACKYTDNHECGGDFTRKGCEGCTPPARSKMVGFVMAVLGDEVDIIMHINFLEDALEFVGGAFILI